MARLLFEMQAVRTRRGPLATGTAFVVYSDEAGTVPADISATVGGSAIAGSTVTVADIPGLGPSALRFYGPTDGTDVLYLRCPSDSSLGVQEIEADVTSGGGGGGVTDHGALTGLADDDHPQYATDTDLTALQAAALAPSTIPGLALWLKADAISGLADGAAVSAWLDQSGNGRDATQTTTANQPTYQTGELNGLPVLRFDGTNDHLRADALADVLGGTDKAYTVFAVTTNLDTTGDCAVLSAGQQGDNDPWTLLRVGSDEVYQAWRLDDVGGSALQGTPVIATPTAGHVLTLLTPGTTVTMAVDGTVNPTAAAWNVGAQTMDRAVIGAWWQTSLSNYLKGDLAEVLVYSRALSTAERQQVEWHLGRKWGVTVTTSGFSPAGQLAAGQLAAGNDVRLTEHSKLARKWTVADRGLWVSTTGNDTNDGLSGGSAKRTVQAALDAIGANSGDINILGGLHDQTAELVVTHSDISHVTLRGVSPGRGNDQGTVLRWPTDLGTGKWGIRSSAPSNATGMSLTVEQLRLRGPAVFPVAFGTAPADMSGVKLNPRMILRNCVIEGFYAGAQLVGDHIEVTHNEITGNYYNLYAAGMSSGGDWVLDNNSLVSPRMASIGVATTGTLNGLVTVTRGHMGYGPYCIYFEPGRDPGDAGMTGTAFQNTSFEAFGQGFIHSPDLTASLQDVSFYDCGFAAAGSDMQISGGHLYAYCQVGSLDNVHFYGTAPTMTIADPEQAIFLANSAVEVSFDHCRLLNRITASASAVPYLITTGATVNGLFRDYDSEGFLAGVDNPAATTIAAGQLLAYYNGTNVRLMAAGRQLAGVAFNGAPAGAYSTLAPKAGIFTITRGNSVVVETTGAVAADAQVQADPATPTKITTWDGGLGFPHVGVMSPGVSTGGAAATTIDLHPSRSVAVTKPTVTGSRGGNAALADLLTKLAALGLITDSTS